MKPLENLIVPGFPQFLRARVPRIERPGTGDICVTPQRGWQIDALTKLKTRIQP
jgi:hypothetical protein